MKIRWKSPLLLSALSMAFAALGFGSCSTSKLSPQERMARLDQLYGEDARLEAEMRQMQDQLEKARSAYENIGRAECVYGGPNMMEEAVQKMRERQPADRGELKVQMKTIRHKMDSIWKVQDKVKKEIGVLSEEGKKK